MLELLNETPYSMVAIILHGSRNGWEYWMNENGMQRFARNGHQSVFCKGYDGIEETSFVIMTEKVLYENPNYDKLKTPAVVRKRGRRLCMLTLFRQNLLAVLNND